MSEQSMDVLSDAEVGTVVGPQIIETQDGRTLLGCDGMAIETDGNLIWIALSASGLWFFAPLSPDEAREAAQGLLDCASELDPLQ